MSNTLSEYTQSTYVNALIKSLVEQNEKIWLNVRQINLLTNHGLKDMFIGDSGNFGKLVVFLKNNLNVTICPIFLNKWIMNDHTFDLINRSSDNKLKNLEITVRGPIIRCNLSAGKYIVFQPRLTKINNVFSVEMKFISTYQNKQINVHFDVNYNNSDSIYHTSLHPGIMDIKWNNKLHIVLPSVEYTSETSSNKLQLCYCKEKEDELSQTIAISMSIMIHNVGEFEIDYADLASTNLLIMSDLTAVSQSYAFPDIISTFYGFSNSVISILDSISDIMFIVFLWYLPKTQKIAHFLMILSVGNLIAVAIIITIYTTNKIETKSLWHKNLFHLLFFVLSPILPAFDWILQKIQTYDPELLVVHTGCDGVLVWFEQELVRNKIFVVESVFESCFQIIIQCVTIFMLQNAQYSEVYLYSSIIISFIVIMSKLVLVSYNRNRSTICFNLLCYSMDVIFSLLFGIFIAAFMFQKIFTAVGLYMTFELLMMIPYCIYYASKQFSLPRWLYVPALLIFCYPLTICILYGFFIYPLLNHVLTNPTEIGRKQLFHRKLYEYCCNSNNESEFNLKLIIINYVCINSYFEILKKTDAPDYYEFAKSLHTVPEVSLYQISLSQFDDIVEAKINPQLSRFVNVKIKQILIRTVFIVICVMLDMFYFNSFQQDSRFMIHYGNFVVPFGIFSISVFCVWALVFIYQIFISKWDKFCYYMIASKHDSFVLLYSVEEFTLKCDEILGNIANTIGQEKLGKLCLQDEGWLQTLQKFVRKLNIMKQDEDNLLETFYGPLSVIIISGIIIGISFLASNTNSNIYCNESNDGILKYNVITISIIWFICFAWIVKKLWTQHGNRGSEFLSAVIFSLFSSQIFVCCYMIFFYAHQNCSNQGIWIVTILFGIIGCLLCGEFFYHWFFRYFLEGMVMLLLIGVFIAKDIVLLVINAKNDCNSAINDYGQSNFVSFNLNEWILIGCVIHIIVTTFFIPQIVIAWLYVFRALFPLYDFDINDYIGVSICYGVFFLSWSIIGFLLYSEMNADTHANVQCCGSVVAWNIIQLLEHFLVFRWVYIHWEDDDDY
eukprot:352640_1